jgi:hypothetical protein
MSGRAIAERLGLRTTTVFKDLRSLGYRKNTPLTLEQIEARKNRVQAFVQENPALTQAEVATALGLSLYMIEKISPHPMKGRADARMQHTYDRLMQTYTVTASLLAKHAATSTVTARNWLRKHHASDLINFRGVKAPVAPYQRMYSGKIVTVRAFERKFPSFTAHPAPAPAPGPASASGNSRSHAISCFASIPD